MHVALVQDGAKDAQTIVFRRATPEAVRELQNAIEPLMAGISRQVPIHDLPGISTDDGVQVIAAAGGAVGGRQAGPKILVWEESKPSWFAVFEALEPFTEPAATTEVRSTPLGTKGPLSVVLSTGDSW